MGNGKICDCCMEFTSLLQSYDGKRNPLTKWADVNITREEIETIILYMQSWTQRQCSCCFRDNKNYERFNWALQILIIVVVEILKHFRTSVVSETSNGHCNDEQEDKLLGKVAESFIATTSKPIWDIEDKDKLIHFVSKVFLNSFPTYVAYKQHMQVKSEEILPQEIQVLSQYIEIHEPETSPYLFRNVALFCRIGGMEALSVCIYGQNPETLPIHQANILVALATNLKTWFNFQSLLKYYVPFRSNVLGYMCKLVDTELKTASARNMAEYIWSAVKDPVDAHLAFDKDGLDLALKYFLSTTLTMRLAGINQINNHINLFNELLNSEHILDSEHLDQHFSRWLLDNQLIQHIFGPNLHVEVIKQSHTILTFLAMEGKISNDHIDIIWQAAQLKHCSKQVYDILSSLICHMEPGPVLHLHSLLWKLEPKDHTEQSLYLASALIKFIWTNAAATLESSPITTNLNAKRRSRPRPQLVELSSSENSVSVEASHSEDEIQPVQIPRVGPIQNVIENSERIDVTPVCLFKSGHLCKVVDSSEDESLSMPGSGKSDDPDNVIVSSSGYIETHSDSDADEERSGNEDGPKKLKRKILRRKKGHSNKSKDSPKDSGSVTPKIDVNNKLEINTRAQDSMEPNAVISELSNLVQMTDSSMMQDFASAPDLLEGSDGSYSSRMSNKSEKNMADFDGEDSNCEDELMQSLTQNQLVELAARNQLRMGNLGPVFGQRPIRHFGRRKRFHSTPGFNFQIDNVCQPGQTLLWDLIQDDKITLLSDGLAIEAQKALNNLLCFNTDKLIRFKFIEGCLDNVSKNRSIVVSLRLLPKLLTSFQQLRITTDIHQVTMWAEREHQMLSKFFSNLKQFKESDGNCFPFPHHAHVQVRLEFLTVVFSIMGSPDDFRLSIEHVDQLWECLATDCRSSDELFIWLTGQVRMRDQHALSAESFRHVFIRKLPSLPPETITMHALTLFQQLCNMARTSGEQDIEAAASSMDYLWKIALCAHSTDVSMTAINYLNGYYISRQLEKEEEFVQRCMCHLAEATEELTHCTPSDEAPLLRIQRALLLLKTHLETFRKRYAYHLRKWFLEGRGVGSHAQLVGEKGAIPIRVVIQPAGYHEKVTLELLSSDYVADLRAEVAKWWEIIQGNIALEKSTPVLGSLLTEGPIRMITQGIELSAEYDEKCLSEVPIKDGQLVYVSMGASRPQKKKDAMEYSSSLPPPPRDKLPVTLLLQSQYFEQLFCLMQSLSSIKIPDRSGGSLPHTKAQVLSRRVWDILMLLPTNPLIHEGFTKLLGAEGNSFHTLLDPASPQKLMYSLYIVEALVKISPIKFKEGEGIGASVEPHTWRHQFVEFGGLRHLFDIFSSGVLESIESGDWSEWKQDCLASLLKILCYMGVVSEDTDCLNEQLYDVNEMPKKRAKRRKISSEKSPIPRLNETMMSMMEVELVMTRLTNILQACSLPRDPNHYKTGFWGRAQVVHYAMALLVCWAFSCNDVRRTLYSQKEFPQWLRRLVLEDPEPAVRREVCTGLYRLCLGVSTDGKNGVSSAPELISHLLDCLPVSLTIKPQQRMEIPVHSFDDGKEPYGPACRDYFWLLGRLLDSLDCEFVKESVDDPDNCVIDLDGLARTLSQAILGREYLEARHNTINDDGLVGLLTTTTVVLKHNPPFKTSKDGHSFLKQVFECLFALPSPQKRYLPKCKSQASRSAAYDLLTEMGRGALDNYYLLQNLLMDQHQPASHIPYPWDYWPHEDGRSSCGYVGLTNLGATCYMASCMQHLYMMPQARSSILGAKFSTESKHEQTLQELQRMFAYLMESERKAYNPRSFCKVYQMDHQPLNTGEQKDMAEFFIDLVSKLEEMTPELKKLVKNLFCGVTSNNVVSLDCPHVSRTLEEFYTVRCQVADMRNLYESLDEVTVKDTLEGDNMYTCSQCGKKVRAEKRACFKKLPRILCFNTMRYTFNMITMMKEKVNTHFSFPLHLDMTGYVEKTLMNQQYQEEKLKKREGKKDGDDDSDSGEIDEDECHEYDLIGVTVHTGTADGGHYYSFIRDRVSPNRDKWFLFNDAEVKPFDPNQIATECFGGEMSTKTYDSVTDKFMDFSFEKTNSAYMLFYERCVPSSSQLVTGDGCLVPSLPGGSSQKQHHPQIPPAQTMELNKELEDWIWLDNMHFLRDKNIFEHTYFNFMSQACGQIPQTLPGNDDVTLLAAKLSATFFLETFIHAKEKPTMVQWVELLTKQLAASQTAAAWLLDHMAETDWWPVQILLKCPNQMVRQMFQRLCIHVIQQLRPRHAHLYMKLPEGQSSDHPNDINLFEFGSFSCVTRFIKRLLSLLEHGAKSHLKHLTEYFTFLHEFSKMGDEECLFLISMQAISAMVNFYLGNKKDDQVREHGSDEEEEEEEVVSIPAEKSKVASLEKMIALVATLVEKSRDEANSLRLSTNDWNSLTGGGKNFPFILQQIRDGINFTSTRNLIFSLCRWDEKLAENIVIAIFQSIQKHPDICHPYFKVLNLLAELVAGMPAGMPKFTELILSRILDVADICPYPTLEWLGAQVPRNKVVHQWCLSSMDTWVEHFLIGHVNQRVRNAAASLLVSLVPNPHFRQGYRSTKLYSGHSCRDLVALPAEAQAILHQIYLKLLNLLKPAKHYTDSTTHSTSKLTAYFAVLTYFTISKVEKNMCGNFFLDLWQLFHPKLSEPSIPCHHNKQALLTFWHHVCVDCPDNIQRIVHNPAVTKHIGFNYILADHEDQDVVMFNRSMLPAYYSILRMCCQSSRTFALNLARHQNITWAFKNISPYPTQYPSAVEELFKMMQIFVAKNADANEQEISDITMFKRQTLQLYLQILDGRSHWSTLISAFRILVENFDDRVFLMCNSGLSILFEAFHMLHTMHHEATACHVTGEIVELLSILTEILRSFRPKEFAHGMQVYNPGDIQVYRFVAASKEWPEVLRKLATLLNTYNCTDLRNTAIETLVEFLYIMPLDCLRTLVPLMVHCHSACQDAQTSGMGPHLGPYFPKRSPHGSVNMKPAVRPPRPMLQMAFPHLGQETVKVCKGLDEDYDRQLNEFYSQYHSFVDLMCRVGFMKDVVNQELVTLSAMVGYEAAPLHFSHFPKLWLEVFNTPSLDRKYITMLVNTNYFTDYVEVIMLEERSCLTNIVIYNFLATYIPKIFDQIASTDQMCKVLLTITMELNSLTMKQTLDVEGSAITILGDLKALSLFYLPTVNGKGHIRNPLPSPAPSVPQLQTILRRLSNFLESISTRKILDSRPGEGPSSKKRKVEELSGDIGLMQNLVGSSDMEPGCSSSRGGGSQTNLPSNPNGPEGFIQKNCITQDLINIILGTIDSLSRSIAAIGLEEEVEVDLGVEPGANVDSIGNSASQRSVADSVAERSKPVSSTPTT